MFKDDSDVNDRATGRPYQRKLVGDPKTNHQQFDDVSPLRKAAAIKAPVLIAHGDRDARVPIEHSEKLVDALKANHKQVEWLELKGEGHTLAKTGNQERFYQALFDFLAAHIGAPTRINAAAPTSAVTDKPSAP